MADRDLSGQTFGGFVLRERLGRGSYGDVYRAEHELIERQVVVKVLVERRSQNTRAKRRFMLEAKILSLLDHDYAVHIYAFDETPSVTEDDSSLLWIAMELVEGATLEEWFKRGPMNPDAFMQYFETLAQGVHAAHQRGIVHRDLKPDNMMVVERLGRLVAKLLDFGSARIDPDVEFRIPGARAVVATAKPPRINDGPDAIVTKKIRVGAARAQRTPTDPPARRRSFESRLTRHGDGLGSILYMAPEQWDHARDATPASDIYALGVIAYEALIGHVPFPKISDDVHPRLGQGEAPELGAGFSSEVDRVLRRALSESPEDRHRSALDLAAELRAALQIGDRAQLLSAAKHWDSKNRNPGWLLGRDALPDLQRLTSKDTASSLSELECSYIANVQRHARRSTWAKRTAASVLLLGAAGFVGFYFAHRAEVAEERAHAAQQLVEEQVRAARKLAETDHLRKLLEKGRAALLSGDPRAESYLAEAQQREPTSSTAFMYSKAVQSSVAEQARLPAMGETMWSATFSPNGTQLVTGDDTSAQVWDAATHQRLFTLAHEDVVYQAIYSPDGAQIVTACGDGAVRVWDAATGSLIRELRRDHITRYFAVAMDTDGRFVVAIDTKGGVADVWSVRSGALLVTLANDAADYPSLAISSDGQWLATSGGNDVRVFNTLTWARALTIPGPQIYALAWAPGGKQLLTGSGQGKVNLWDVPSGHVVHQLGKFDVAIDAVACSPDGRWVAAAGRDGAERFWDASTGEPRGHGNYLHNKIISIEFDRTSTRAVAAGVNGAVAIADPSLAMPLAIFNGASEPVMSAHFDPSSSRVVGAVADGTARIWDASPPYFRWGTASIEDDCGLVTSLEPDKRFVAVACRSHPTRIWDTQEGRLLADLPNVTPVDGGFSSAYPAVSDAGDRAAIARGRKVEVYSIPERTLVRTIVHGAAVNAVAFSSTGDIVSGDVAGAVIVTRGNGAQLVLPVSPDGIDVAGFLSDGRIVTADAKQHLRIYDPIGIQLADLETNARVKTLRMSSDGHHLITIPKITGRADPLELWDVERYGRVAPLGGPQKGKKGAYSARFIEGEQIVTAGGDGAVRLWDSATGALLRTYQGPSRFLLEATRAGSMIIAGNADGALLFWDFSSGDQLWTMPAHQSHLLGLRVDGSEIVTRGGAGDISRWRLPDPDTVIRTWQAHNRDIVSK